MKKNLSRVIFMIAGIWFIIAGVVFFLRKGLWIGGAVFLAAGVYFLYSSLFRK